MDLGAESVQLAWWSHCWAWPSGAKGGGANVATSSIIPLEEIQPVIRQSFRATACSTKEI